MYIQVTGIDPGLDGAIALYDGDYLSVVDIKPYTEAAPNKGRGRVVNWGLLSYDISPNLSRAEAIFIEQVGSMPGQGVASMFKFGYICGGLRGIVAASSSAPCYMVTPQKWKKYYELGADKLDAYQVASNLFPEYHDEFFVTPKGRIKDGAVEAALIAKYGYDILREEQ